ncbi:WW domain binding protein 1-like [Cryptotermes secundus]|uniref:WW domain binding protein 1-like n=1 Tax=Cryptotermes secundus TaxID=105785 RepID=UPI000CD7C6D9|nr:WW domain binding protein 1-like [Cryptotermes secundus]
MALWYSTKFLCFVQIVVFSDITHAYYCEWDLCDVDQYCCGDNQCCSNVYSQWYFWAGIIFLIIMLSSCGGFFRYCYTGYRPQIIVHQITNYVPFPTDRSCSEERQGLVAHEDVEAPMNHPESPPPPYSASVSPGKEIK